MNCKFIMFASCGLFVAHPLVAATLTVTSLADSGPGSLRNQVAASLAGDTIQFAVHGTIVLSSFIDINHTLFVQGPGPAALVVDANLADRAFTTAGNPVVLSGMTIQRGLVIGTSGTDAVYCENGGAGGDANGGAIRDTGSSIILSNCWFRGNLAHGGPGGRGGDDFVGICYHPGNGGSGGSAAGGAFYSTTSIATVINCTFSDNHAIGGQGGRGGNSTTSYTAGGTGGQGGGADAGAVRDTPPGTVLEAFVNCTFSGNSSLGGNGGNGGNNVSNAGGPGGNGGAATAGAISCIQGKWLACTIVSNSAVAGVGGSGGSGSPPGASGGSGLELAGGVAGYAIPGAPCICDIANTILAENHAGTFPNYSIAFNDLGFNYVGTFDYPGYCAFSFPSRIGGVASPLHPLLGPLAQNGGGLPTHAPLPGSPVIDWGNKFGLSTDERGAPRPFGSPAVSGGDGSDIGAFEFGSTALAIHVEDGKSKMTITWPASYGDFTLQFTWDLLVANSWQDVTNPPAVAGSQFVFTNAPSSANRFFRLIHH
jgi:hypothetical protein